MGFLAGMTGAWSLAVTGSPLVAVDPAAVLNAPAPVRAGIAVFLVLTLGGVLVYVSDGRFDRSVTATTARPLRGIVYGIAAHAVILFASIYLTSRIGEAGISGLNAGSIGVMFLVLLFLGAAILGFTVVGAAVVELLGAERSLTAPVAGALMAGGAAVLGPVYGGAVWIIVVSTGIGGPVRRWVNASIDEQ